MLGVVGRVFEHAELKGADESTLERLWAMYRDAVENVRRAVDKLSALEKAEGAERKERPSTDLEIDRLRKYVAE